ncbi:MAG TPA: tetratricopeptide repeat protein [Terriglobia bacterium]|nr:tetratricopeptide repeat protein [Terriglobia bacterium]
MSWSFRTETAIGRRQPGITIPIAVIIFVLLRGHMSFGATEPSGNCAASTEKANALLEQHQSRKARQVLQAAIKTCDKNAGLFNVLGLAYDFDGQFEQAQAAYRKAVMLDPVDSTFRNNLASSYLRSGKQASGIAEFKRVLESDPRNPAANLNLGSLYLTEKLYGRALLYLEAGGAAQTTDPVLLLEMTDAYFGSDKPEAAISTAERASRLAGSDPRIHFSLGTELARHGEYQRAAEQFQAVPPPDRDAATDLDLGMTLSKLGRYADASQAYQDAIRQDPSNPDPYLHMGLDTLATGESRSAVDWLRLAHDKAPGRPDISYALAEGLISAKDFEGARSLLTTTLQSRPGDPALLKALGDLHLKQGNPAMAEKAYLQSLKSDPHGAGARLALAKTYTAQKKNSLAIDELKKVLEIDPHNAEAQAEQGHIAMDAGQPDVAMQWIRKALSNDSNNVTANQDLAALALRQDKPSEARMALERLLKINPNNPGFHYLLGQTFMKLGDPAKARAEFNLSRKLQSAGAVGGTKN